MPTKREVWLAADNLRKQSKPVTVRSVRGELTYGGSYRDIGPLLASWKADRKYTRVIELAGLPDHIQTQLSRAGINLWQAALQDATKFLNAEREQARAVAEVDQDLRDEAFAAADVLEARVEHLQSEIERLKSELELARNQSNGFLEKLLELRSAPPDPDGVRAAENARSRDFWKFVKEQAFEVLSALGPGSSGLTTEEIIQQLPQEVVLRANREGEVLSRQNLSKRLHESSLRGRLFEREGGRYLPLSERTSDDLDAA